MKIERYCAACGCGNSIMAPDQKGDWIKYDNHLSEMNSLRRDLVEARDPIKEDCASLEEALTLLKIAKCPNDSCDHGVIPHPTQDGDWELEQCQWCYEKDLLIKKLYTHSEEALNNE